MFLNKFFFSCHIYTNLPLATDLPTSIITLYPINQPDQLNILTRIRKNNNFLTISTRHKTLLDNNQIQIKISVYCTLPPLVAGCQYIVCSCVVAIFVDSLPFIFFKLVFSMYIQGEKMDTYMNNRSLYGK